jgi:hypothetical protein
MHIEHRAITGICVAATGLSVLPLPGDALRNLSAAAAGRSTSRRLRFLRAAA